MTRFLAIATRMGFWTHVRIMFLRITIVASSTIRDWSLCYKSSLLHSLIGIKALELNMPLLGSPNITNTSFTNLSMKKSNIHKLIERNFKFQR